MSIILLMFVLAFIGLVCWGMVTYIPMPAPIKTTIIVVAVIACVLYALHAMGIGVPNPSVPQLR